MKHQNRKLETIAYSRRLLYAQEDETVMTVALLAGLDLRRVRGALVDEYGAHESGISRGEPPAAQIAATSSAVYVRVHPNPFNPSTHIQLTLPAEDIVTLRIYNLQGQKVLELLRGYRPAAKHTILWDGRDDSGRAAASGPSGPLAVQAVLGTYFLQIEAGRSKLSGKASVAAISC